MNCYYYLNADDWDAAQSRILRLPFRPKRSEVEKSQISKEVKYRISMPGFLLSSTQGLARTGEANGRKKGHPQAAPHFDFVSLSSKIPTY
jgi:hypothetical protein